MNSLFASFLALCVSDAPLIAAGDPVLPVPTAWCASHAVLCGNFERPTAPRLVSDCGSETMMVLCGGEERGPRAAADSRRAAPVMRVRPLRRPAMTLRRVSDDQNAARDESRAWIGVRVAPVPEPLAAHLDQAGVMIANVAKDSPADAAGIERYDVVIAFNGADVESGEALVEAIQAAGPGRQARITVLRKARATELRITPTSAPDSGSVEFKYEEPTDPVVDNSTTFRGRALRIGPDGQMQLEDLGDLQNLNDLLPQDWMRFLGPGGQWQGLHNLPGPLHFDLDFDWDDLGTDATRVEVRVQTDSNGQTMSVRRDADGRITVERTDADGNKTTAEYDNEDAVESADPEAHKLLNQHGGPNVLRLRPNWRDLPGRQQDFRKQMEHRMKDMRDKLQQRGVGRSDGAQARPRVRVETRTSADQGGSTSEALAVSVDDDGRFTVKVNRNGDRAEFTFKNEAEFKQQQPDLYERYRKMRE